MATTTQTDPWMRPQHERSSSADRWSAPSPLEQRFFDQPESEPPRHSWAHDTELDWDPDRTSVPTSRRRSAVARSVGVVGVLAVLGLAVAAFAPRMPAAASQLAHAANRIALPGDPTLLPGPEPTPLDRDPNVATPSELPAAPVTLVEAAPPVEPTPPAVESHAAVAPSMEARSESEMMSSAAPVQSQEPALTADEIEMRKQRYEEWLQREGLERVH